MKQKLIAAPLLAAIIASITATGTLGADAPPAKPKDPNATLPFVPNAHTSKKALEHFTNEKFGVYINWGPFTLRGQESSWSMSGRAEYESYYPKWKPESFTANEWGDLCKTLGANYLVWVVKHHDGLCLWDTQTTDNKITDLPFKRNLTTEVADMCKGYGLSFGTCLSIIDIHEDKWEHCYPHGAKMPGYPDGIPHLGGFIERQTLELIKDYKPSLLWYDGGWVDGWRTSNVPATIESKIRAADPDVLITRLGNHVDDFESMEAKLLTYRDVPWETVTSVAYPRYAWGPDLHYKSVPFLVETLSRVVCGNGNYLLCFVPDPNGHFPEVQQKIAAELGGWVHKNSEAIFNTHGGPYYPNVWGGSTRKGSKVYLFLLSEAPEKLSLPTIGTRILSSQVISGGKISVQQTDSGVTISIPKTERDSTGVSVVELTLENEVPGMIEASKSMNMVKASLNNDVRPIEERKGKVLN